MQLEILRRSPVVEAEVRVEACKAAGAPLLHVKHLAIRRAGFRAEAGVLEGTLPELGRFVPGSLGHLALCTSQGTTNIKDG